MRVCNKLPSISYFSKRIPFCVSPLRQAEHLAAWQTVIAETQHDTASVSFDRVSGIAEAYTHRRYLSIPCKATASRYTFVEVCADHL
jgi:hypothetical protein